VSDHPLKPDTDRRLGKSVSLKKAYGVLAIVSNCYPPPKGKFSRVTHPSAT